MVLTLSIVLIGIKLKTLRGGLVVDYQVRPNGNMLHVVVVETGSILGAMKMLLVSVL